MKFDVIDNLLKYAGNTICIAESPTLPGGRAEVGLVSNDYTLPGWPQDCFACLVTENKEFHPIVRVEDWELKSPVNGYVSYNLAAGPDVLFYLERDPKRMWKVGLCSQNSSPKVFWDRSPSVTARIKAISDLQKRRFGIYSLDDPKITGKTAHVLSAKYAVIQSRLFYRGDPVANIDFKNKKLLFTDYCNNLTTEYHVRNLSSKLGGFTPVCVEVRKESINLKEYNYEFDI